MSSGRNVELNTSWSLYLAFFKLIGGNQCFKFLRSRLPKPVIDRLNDLIAIRCKITKAKVNVAFLTNCIHTEIYPKHFFKTVRSSKMKPTTGILKRLADSYLESTNEELSRLHTAHELVVPVVETMSLFCRIKFSNYCKSLLNKARESQIRKNTASLSTADTVSQFAKDLDKHVKNVSSVVLTRTQKEALSVGLKFCIPPTRNQSINVKTQFECLFDQLKSLKPSSEDTALWFKSKLVDLAHQYQCTPVSQTCQLSKQHIEQLKVLRKNKDVMILPPDKGSGVVLLDRKDYIEKMTAILSDQAKFSIDPIQKDAVQKVESNITERLKSLQCKGIINEQTFKQLRPKGTTTPRMYGIPKMHKPGMPLRPILSMVASPYHELAKWLVDAIEPVRKGFTPHSLKDTFEFIEHVSKVNTTGKVMISFDVESLFTNVPLDEVINIITNFVSHNPSSCKVPAAELSELLKACTTSVQFLFDGKFYRQVNGVAMGSPLGPVLADIFMGYMEQILSTELNHLTFYKRYVDDIFVICDQSQVGYIHKLLNSVHQNLKFTYEEESNNQLSFLDVCLIKRNDGSLSRAIHRKPTWSGQYIHFKSFAPIKYKRGLVRCLFERVKRIATSDQVEKELSILHETLKENGYPTRFIDKYSKGKSVRVVTDTVPLKNVYLSLPFKGDNVSSLMKRRLDAAIRRTYYAATLVYIDQTQRIPTPPRKDPVPLFADSNIIYGFDCICGSKYVGRTTRHLGKRIDEHIPKWLYTTGVGNATTAITKHLQQTGHIIDVNTAFKRIFKPKRAFMLNFAEAVIISTQTPNLCSQKQFITNLSLF